MQIDLSRFGDPDRPMLSAIQRTLLLKTFSGFANLHAEELALLASICRERHYAPGEMLHEPGKPVESFHLIVDGEVQMYRAGRPLPKLIGRSTVGGLAALSRDPRGAHAVAVTDVIALELDSEDMDEVFEDNFTIIRNVMMGLGHGLRAAQMRAGGGAAVDSHKRIQGVDTSRRFNLVDKIFILRGATNFAEISIEALSQLAREAEEVRYRAGDVIWRAGVLATWSLLVADGVVECIPETIPRFEFGASFYVGGMDSITQSPHWYACHAKTDVVALKLHNQPWLDVLEDHTDMALEMTRNFARGVTSLLERQADLEEAARAAAEAPQSVAAE